MTQMIKQSLALAVACAVVLAVYFSPLLRAQATEAPQAQGSPIVTVPGTPPVTNPELPSQPAVSVTEVKSPAAPAHYMDQAIWALIVSFFLQFLKKQTWFPMISEESTARLKTQVGFITAVLTAAGIHFAVSGNFLDGGVAFTVSGVSLDAIKDVGWQWAAQQALYKKIVKEAA